MGSTPSLSGLGDVGLVLLVAGVGLLYLTSLSIWMYVDSKRRGAEDPWEWALEPWAGGLLAPAIYLEERKRFGEAEDDEAAVEADAGPVEE